MAEVSFDRVISDHLALCERNKRLERQMPLDQYRDEVGGGSTTPVTRSMSSDEPETVTVVNAGREQWLDQESFWDSSGERPLPEFDWGDD
jgi:hypothetical protein